eukprot:8104639-Karenia_brevis.AAC.1
MSKGGGAPYYTLRSYNACGISAFLTLRLWAPPGRPISKADGPKWSQGTWRIFGLRKTQPTSQTP